VVEHDRELYDRAAEREPVAFSIYGDACDHGGLLVGFCIDCGTDLGGDLENNDGEEVTS
jgi:hypothetical protein